jgi:Tol biopolymer transport system component
MSATFAVSEAGVLAFQTGRSTGSSRLVWFDRTGKRLGVLGEPARYGSEVHLSPDGSRAAVVAADSGTTRDIWIFDVKRGLPTKFTFDPPDEREPIWAPDGNHIVYYSTRSGSGDLEVFVIE